MNHAKQLIILFTLCIIVISCSEQGELNGTPVINADSLVIESEVPVNISEDVEASKFKELIESGKGILLDVRTPEEFIEGNIQGSTNIDFNGVNFSAEIDSLDKEIPVYVYCQAGGRSGKAKDLLLEKGFKEVYNLIGGFGSWPY